MAKRPESDEWEVVLTFVVGIVVVVFILYLLEECAC